MAETSTTVVEISTEPVVPITWSVLEFEQKDRHPDWIWYAGLIFGAAATLAFFYGNIFFGIFLVLSGVAVIMFALREPKMLTITLTEKEMTINEEHIAYTQVRRFWIDESGKPDKLLLHVKGSFVPLISLSLEGVSAETIRTRMKDHAPEEVMHESFGTKIAERLGF